MRGNKSILLLLAVAWFSCAPSHEEITGIDWDQWKSDRFGCGLKRQAFGETLDAQKDRLKSLSEMDIVNLMGRPDQTELYKRNQKFFTYFISGGPGCDAADSSSLKLVIRFNAVGLAKEVAVEGDR